jgi:fatty-acyl-CoA synthase
MINTNMTLYEALRSLAEDRPKQVSIILGDERITFAQVIEHVDLLARYLYGKGIKKGDKILVLLSSGPLYAYSFFAAARIGAVFVPLNPQTKPRSLRIAVQETQPTLALLENSFEEIKNDPALIPCPILFSDELRNILQNPPPELPADKDLADIDIKPSDLQVILYTSGTTGAPKGVMHTHKSLIAPVLATTKVRERWMSKIDLKWFGRSVKALARYRMRLLRVAGKPMTFLSTAGWHGMTGLEVMLQGFLMGDRLVVMTHFHPREALRLIEKEKVTIFVAVPMMLRMILKVYQQEKFDTSSLLVCAAGGAPCPPTLAQELQKAFGCAIYIGFGTTETGGGVSVSGMDDSVEKQTTTIGMPLIDTEVKIVDENNNPLPPGQIGELVTRSDGIMMGYYQAPEATEKVIDKAGWYYTGDMAVVDDKGYIKIVGRKKDMIIRGGQNVYPAEVEAFLATYPKVQESAVFGIPSEISGETVCAYIIPKDGEQIDTQEILDYCRSELEVYKIPSIFRFVEEFPRSDNGKPQKYKMRQELIDETMEKQDE